jgi:5'-nucleotidase
MTTSVNKKAVPFFNVAGNSDPVALVAGVSFDVVNEFIRKTPKGQKVLLLGYGVNVNIADLINSTMPPVAKTRLTGEANTNAVVYNETSDLFTCDNVDPPAAGINAAYNGDTSLSGETWVVARGGVSVRAFTIDFSA